MRNCTDQLLSLTTFIEAGFQQKLKTGVVFIDLTSAYDTVWRKGLLMKILKMIPCKTIYRLLNNMLTNRSFNVYLNNGISKSRMLNNGLPQGAVLAPLLFNVYLNDLPNTTSEKFGYADDWAMASQHQNIAQLENELSSNLQKLDEYFKKWRLCMNITKTESSCFHLNNKQANSTISVSLNGTIVQYNPHPKYLGVTLDRTLSYRQHLENTAGKMKSRNNLIQKLAGTSWGASTHALRVSSLGLVYPVAEYGCSVWMNSAHTQLIDRQLNTTMRLITGTLCSTPIPWLPVLSNISPPHLRREQALVREYNKITTNMSLPIHRYYGIEIPQRLKSRNPPWTSANELISSNWNMVERWKNEWQNSSPFSSFSFLIENPSEEVPGFDLPRRLWSALNRIRTNHGRCAESFFKWGIVSSPSCDCGAFSQTINHIVIECPRRHFLGSIEEIHSADSTFITWLKNLDLQI